MWIKNSHANPVGLVVAPAAAPIAFFFASNQLEPFNWAILAVIAYLTMILVGLPIISFLGRRNKLTAVRLIGSGVIVGIVLAMLLCIALFQIPQIRPEVVIRFLSSWAGLLAAVIGAFFGFLISSTYVLIAYVQRRRAARDHCLGGV